MHYLCNHWIEPSSISASFVLKENVDAKKVSVVYHAIDSKRFTPAKADRSLSGRNEGFPGMPASCCSWAGSMRP